MPEIIACPSCQRKLRLDDDAFGQTVQCPSCQNTFVAEKPAPAPRPADEPPYRPRDEAPPRRYDDDLPRPRYDEPRPRRRYDDEDYPRPRRSGRYYDDY